MKSIYPSTLFSIYITVFINIIAFSMVFPLLPVYARVYNASNITIGLLAASFAIAQLLFSPIWGMLSDKYGRRPVIVVGLIGLSASFLLFAVAGSLVTLFISRFFQGVFSGASIPAARAYIADITTSEERVKEMGRVGAALALGIILGPALGGIVAEIDLALPFLGASIVSLVSLFFVLKFLPESLAFKAQHPLALHKGLFVSVIRIKAGLQGALMPLFVLSLLWSFALSNMAVAVPLLGIEKFALQAANIGIIFTVMGLVAVLVQFFLISKITSMFGDRITILGGLLIMAFGFALMPLVPAQLMFLYAAVAIAGLGSAVSRPVITALVSKETHEGQGVTMGTANAFESLGRLVGPLLGGFLFVYGMAVPFLFSGAAIIVVLVFIIGAAGFLKKPQLA